MLAMVAVGLWAGTERRARAVGLAGGVCRRDDRGRRARHGAAYRCRSSSPASSPRWSRSGLLVAGGGAAAGRRSARRSSRCSRSFTATPTAPSCPATRRPSPMRRASRSPPRLLHAHRPRRRARRRQRCGRLAVRGAGALVAAAGVALGRRLTEAPHDPRRGLHRRRRHRAERRPAGDRRSTVANTGDRPIQVGSHYHFAETNPALHFDRDKARGIPPRHRRRHRRALRAGPDPRRAARALRAASAQRLRLQPGQGDG